MMDANEKFQLVKRNTTEIFTEEELKELLEEKDNPTAYWGIAPTGPFHMGYIASLGKVFDFSKAGIKTKVMIADVHAALDDLKSPWEETKKRREYCKKCIQLAFPWEEEPEFIFGSDFEMGEEYQEDLLKLSTQTTINRAKRAASTVVRMKTPKVSEIIYPLMQSLDEEYLDVDIQLAGKDHRQLLAYAREYLPKIGYKSRVEIMTPLVAGLKGPEKKMSASKPSTTIKVYDSEEAIREKVKDAYCPEGVIEKNPVLQLAKFVVFPVKGELEIERDEKYGGDLKFDSYEELERSFDEEEVHPLDLKGAISSQLISIFSDAREYFSGREDELEELGEEFLPD